jgi:hypothetical protein
VWSEGTRRKCKIFSHNKKIFSKRWKNLKHTRQYRTWISNSSEKEPKNKNTKSKELNDI